MFLPSAVQATVEECLLGLDQPHQLVHGLVVGFEVEFALEHVDGYPDYAGGH